ncbi:SDR family oxidoreductase [Janibacter alkaliphilus]|uniref:dTDP-glucose 4,6-dehydratase n=1 Tax=Janibacter alkaliphilus TaxID=1069963 RepID=A0A852XI57_9MICO|nr:dTDP-glucose 4,6-dehydratase [Janibacter alkaliphilus]
MRAVVTGGSGFLGSHLCERLVARGDEVVALDNFVTGTPANVAHLADEPGFDLVEVDVTRDVTVAGDVDLVLHLASPASPVDYLQLPIETLEVGSIGTMHALALAREKGARFVLASTSEVYGDPAVHPQPESYWGHVNPVGPRGVYDEAKRFAEALTLAHRSTHGVDTGIVRIFNTFGPRMRPDDGRAIPNFIRQALAGQPVTVAGDGSQTRSICYVDDLITGILAMADSEHAGPVNIGNPHELSMTELAEWIIELTGSTSTIRHIARPVDDPTVRQPDTALARELLGWEPQVEIEDALRRTIDWFRSEAQGPRLRARPLSASDTEHILAGH